MSRRVKHGAWQRANSEWASAKVVICWVPGTWQAPFGTGARTLNKRVKRFAPMKLTIKWETQMLENNEAYDLFSKSSSIYLQSTVDKSPQRIFLFSFDFYNCVTSAPVFCIRSLAWSPQSPQTRSSWCRAPHANSHLCVASRTELAAVLPLGRKQPTRRAERKLGLGKIHNAARLGDWRNRQLSSS